MFHGTGISHSSADFLFHRRNVSRSFNIDDHFFYERYDAQLRGHSAVSIENKRKMMKDKQQRTLGYSMYDKRSSFSDVTLECNGGVIQAHRIVLSASCNYFDAMFRSNLKESSMGTVKLHEIDVGVMEVVVKFLYTVSIGEIEDDVSLLKQLYVVADFMQIPELIQRTTDTLIRKINLDNYLELWDLASKLGNSQLVYGILEMLNKKCRQFVDGDHCVELNFDQMSTVLRNFNGKCATEKLVQMILRWAEKDFDKRFEVIEKLVKLLDLNGLTNMYLYELTNDDRIMKLPHIVADLLKIAARRLQKYTIFTGSQLHDIDVYEYDLSDTSTSTGT